MRTNKLFAVILVCMVAMIAGFTSCNQTVETQIFDLSFDQGDLKSGEVAAYQLLYEPIFIAEISKVAEKRENTNTFLINNSTEKKAKSDVKAAFELATVEAQKVADDAVISMKGMTVILKHSTVSKQTPKDFLTYTFK